MKKIINTNIGLVIICLFSAVCVMADFIVIDKALDSYVVNSNVKMDDDVLVNDEDELKDEKVTDENIVNSTEEMIYISYDEFFANNNIIDSDFNVRTVFDRIKVKNNLYADVKVVDGGLDFVINKYNFDDDLKNVFKDSSYNEKHISYVIPNEKIEFIYYFLYQPAATRELFVLTENKNLYVCDHGSFESDNDFSFLTDFKLVYSNVSNMKLIDYPFYNEPECNDCIEKLLYADIDGKLIQI